jgi:hypothetical protein
MSVTFRHWQVQTPVILQSIEENTETFLVNYPENASSDILYSYGI